MSNSQILMVDDDEFVARALYELLSHLGYSVLRARNAQEGWELFQERQCRAVVTDNVMKGDPVTDMSGFALAARIKEASPQTPVIMLTAIPPEGALGVCDAVLTKPVPLRELAATLERLHVLPDLTP